MKTTNSKRYLGRIPVTTYLPDEIAAWLAMKAPKEALSPGTWIRKSLAIAFEAECDEAARQQQQYMAAMMRAQGAA